MLAFVMASMMVAASDPAPLHAAQPKAEPTRYCREMGNASSRMYAVKICRTRAQWQRWEACHGVTVYCTPKKRVASASGTLGRETAFPLSEGSRIVCRLVSTTGTRLKTQDLCMPQREWERMWKDSAAGMLKAQDHSTRVIGQK